MRSSRRNFEATVLFFLSGVENGGVSLSVLSVLPFFFSLFSSGPLIAFHKAPQLVVGSSETLFVCFAVVADFEPGGRAGGLRQGKTSGVGTTNLESLKTMVACDSDWCLEKFLITKQFAQRW